MNIFEQAPNQSLDQDSYLQDYKVWNKAWATNMAQSLGYDELNNNQWKLIFALREHYTSHKTVPNKHYVCKITGLDHFCLERYFANDGKQAWKIAGLPEPGEEIKAYL